MKTLDKLLKSIITTFAVGTFALSTISCKEENNVITNIGMERDGDYRGVIVLAYDKEENRFTDYRISEIYDELIVGSKRFGQDEINDTNLSIEEWYKIEAKKYGKEIEIPLTFYPEQIKVPEKDIKSDSDLRSIDLENFREFLSEEYPEINNYDFVSILYNDNKYNYYKFAGSAIRNIRSFMVRYNSYIKNRVYAHEFAHLLSAKDKYGSFDKYNIYDENDIMKNMNPSTCISKSNVYLCGKMLNKDIIVSEPTAEEIGWIK